MLRVGAEETYRSLGTLIDGEQITIPLLLFCGDQVAVVAGKTFEAIYRLLLGVKGRLLDAADELVHRRLDRFVVEVDVVLALELLDMDDGFGVTAFWVRDDRLLFGGLVQRDLPFRGQAEVVH